MKNIGARALKSIPLVLLALITASGASFAGGDLFDDDYFDCPARTRLQAWPNCRLDRVAGLRRRG